MFLYRNLYFSLQLLLCLIPFIIYQQRRKFFWLRLGIGFVCYCALSTVTFVVIRSLAGGATQWGGLAFILVTLYLCFAVWGIFQVDFLGALYLVTSAYALQHIAYSLQNILNLSLDISLPYWLNILLMSWVLYIFIACLFFFLFIFPQRSKYFSVTRDFRVVILSFFTLILCVSLSSLVSNFIRGSSNNDAVRYLRICCSIYAIIGCFFTLFLQSGFSRENKLAEEKKILDQLLHKEKDRHKLSKETIDIINAKCHDLKHQIVLLENMDVQEERRAYIEEIKKHVTIYDNITNTGNAALDLIMTEKGLLCDNNKISFSYIVDGGKLSFMSSSDIVSLFGNALDNAIESQLQEDETKRFISFTVKEKSGIIYVHMDNYCSHGLEFNEGLPRTTKKDWQYHGFGTKSIRYIVRKYNGEVYMEVKNERFNLDILFPASLVGKEQGGKHNRLL